MKPDFLFIGAPRAGSTWLFKNLSQHPDVWLPPCKNILYFHPRFQIYRLKFLKYFGKGLLDKNPETRRWYRKFFLMPLVNDAWYQGLFPDTKTIKGEVSEAYCSLPEEAVKHVHDLMPDVKIIFTLRNPFERSLSHAKLGVAKRKGKNISDIPPAELIAHIDHPSSEDRSFYTHTLEKWERFFPKEQFLIRFYEDVTNTPEKYIEDICKFLDIEYKKDMFSNTIESVVNASSHEGIPAEVTQHAARKYAQEIEKLATRFGGPSEAWLKDVKKII